MVGIDASAWDVALPVQACRATESGQRDIFWAAHVVGVECEYCQIERLTNLDKPPPFGFTVCAFPLKAGGNSAASARRVGYHNLGRLGPGAAPRPGASPRHCRAPTLALEPAASPHRALRAGTLHGV